MSKPYISNPDLQNNILNTEKWLKEHLRHADLVENLEGFYMRLGGSQGVLKDILWFCYGPTQSARLVSLNQSTFQFENEKYKMYQIFTDIESNGKDYKPSAIVKVEIVEKPKPVLRMKEAHQELDKFMTRIEKAHEQRGKD